MEKMKTMKITTSIPKSVKSIHIHKHISKHHKIISPLNYPLVVYPFAFIDYLWVLTIYIMCSFGLSVLIDGHILAPFDKDKESNDSSFFIFMKILLQFSVQGFIAIMLCALLQKIPSPMKGIYGYDPHSTLGLLIRTPAIISVLLFALAQSLRARLLYFFSRFNNTAELIKQNLLLLK